MKAFYTTKEIPGAQFLRCACNDDCIMPPTAPMRRGRGNIRGTRRSRCISIPAPRRGVAAPGALAGPLTLGRPRGRGRRNCRSRNRSAPSSDAADLVQQVIQRILDRLLRLRRRAEEIDLEL